MVNNKTTKVGSTVDTTCGCGSVNTSVAILRGGPHPYHGLVVANGNEYGIAGGYSVSATVSGIIHGPHFLCSTFSTFGPHRAVTFFRDLNIPLGAREKGHIFPMSSGTISVISTLIGAMGTANIGVMGTATYRVLDRGNAIANIGARGNSVFTTSDIIVTANNTSCPIANSANSNCGLTGSLKRAIARVSNSLMPVRYRRNFYAQLSNLALGGIALSLFRGSGGGPIFYRVNRVLFARFKVSNPLILSTSTFMGSNGRCHILVSLGPTLDLRRLSGHVLESFDALRGGSFSGSLSTLLPGDLVPIIIALSNVSESGGIGRVDHRSERELYRVVGGFPLGVASLEPIRRTVVAHNNISIGRVGPTAVRSGLMGKLFFTNRIVSISTFANNFGLRVTFSANFLMNRGMWWFMVPGTWFMVV